MTKEDSGRSSWFSRFRKSKKDKPAKNVTKEAELTGAEPTEATEASIAVPSKGDYFIEASRRTIDIISGVAGIVGVPLVKEVLDIGLSVLTTCETINEVQEKVVELKNRVASFLLVIAKIAKDPKENPLFKLSQDLIEELQDLKNCLTTITTRLETIRKQNVLLTSLLPDANMKTIEECVNAFQDGIDRFQTLRGIHAAQDLSKIHSELEDIYGLTKVVVAKVENIEVEVREMKSSVDELKTMLDKSRAEDQLDLISMEMPPIPEIFLGRDTVVEQIAEALASGDTNKSRVCILGPGGIGKTSAALAVVEHLIRKAKFARKNCIWIPCVSLTSPSALLAHLARRFGISTQKDTLRVLITTLQQDSNHHVILLDNFETPWHPIDGDQTLTKTILRALDDIPNVAILVTMRSEEPPLLRWKSQAMRLDVLPIDHCRRVYTTIDPFGESDENLDPLLEAIGRLPYAVTLVATQGRYACASPSQMLEGWNSVGSQLLIDVEDSSKGINSSIELSVKSRYVASSAGAIELLQVLSMLPGGVYQDDLSTWMKSWSLPALSTLRNSALVVTRNVDIGGKKRVHLFVLPVVQSYMRHSSNIPDRIRQEVRGACVKFLADRKSIVEGPNDPAFRDDLPPIVSQEVNIQAIMADIVSDLNAQGSSSASPAIAASDQLDALLVFAFYYCWTHPRLDIAEQVLSISQHSESLLHEAEATSCLAMHHELLYKSASAVTLMERARDLFLSLEKPLYVKACFIHCRIPINLLDAGCGYATGQASITKLKALWQPLYSSDPVLRGLVAYSIARFLWMRRDVRSSILPPFLVAQAIFTVAKRPHDLRNCYQAVIRVHLEELQYKEARDYINLTLELTAKERLPEDCVIYIHKARCLKALGDWSSELRETLQDGLVSARRLGWPFHTAILLEELAEVYVRDEDWLAARLAFDEILKECGRGEGKSIDTLKVRAEKNLLYIQTKQAGSHDKSVGYNPHWYWEPERY